MATNQLPVNRDMLITFATVVANGLQAEEARIGVKQNTVAAIRADLSAAAEAGKTFNLLKDANVRLKRALAAVDERVKMFIVTAKDILVPLIGRPWSSLWQATGFPDQSVRVPRNMMARLVLVKNLGTYFQANPDKQGAHLNITHDQAIELALSLHNAITECGTSEGNLEVARVAADSTERALRWRLSALQSELRLLLEDNDPTWYRIGLNRPADPAIPAAPGDVVVTGGPPGSIDVQWVASRRAERYRIYKKEAPDGEFVPIATTAGSVAKIEGLEEGSTLLIQVRAANAAGESQPSAPAEIVVPTAPAAPAQA